MKDEKAKEIAIEKELALKKLTINDLLHNKSLDNYDNKKYEIIFLPSPSFKKTFVVNENNLFIPRFTLKGFDIFDDFPINTKVEFSEERILKAINYGMIVNIQYHGEEDDSSSGHDRVIYPMIYGRTKEDNKYVMCGYHLKGFSVSEGTYTEKVWRIFRTDRILGMDFTGAFFRLAPDGYNANHKSIKNILASADLNDIRNNQQELIKLQAIQPKDDMIFKVSNVKLKVKPMNFNFKVFNPYELNVLKKSEENITRVSFLKSVVGNNYICIIGISVEKNITVGILDDGKDIGKYTSFGWYFLKDLKGKSNIGGMGEFKAYISNNVK